MSSNLWDQPGVPHKGWRCVDVIDLRPNGESVDEVDYERCQMCGNERIRYVHIMEHSDYHELRVGCVCAQKMSDDYEGPKQRESQLRNRASQRSRWLSRKWRTSMRGNSYLKTKGYVLTVFPKGKRWGYSITIEQFNLTKYGKKTYATEDEAKLALFDEFYEEAKLREIL